MNNTNSSKKANRSSVSSLLDRTRSATLGRIGKRSSQMQENTFTNNFSLYDDHEDETDEPVPRAPKITSEYYSRYEIMTEFMNLRNPSHCPLGIYLIPSSDNLYVWFGVLFVHKGYYKSGAFKFRLEIPENYPNQAPSITFLTDMFHPLVDSNGRVNIAQQFPIWRPYQDYTFHVLHYLKNMFKKVVLDGLNDKYCWNKEAYRLYRTDLAVFAKLSHQCAQLSITENYLYDHFPDNSLIRFAPLSDAKFEELKAQMLKSVTNPVSTVANDEEDF